MPIDLYQLIKGNASKKREYIEPLLAHHILFEGGQTDAESQSIGDKDEKPKKMSLKNRVANTLDISFLCEKLADYLVKPIPVSTLLDQDAKYIDKRDGEIEVIFTNGKLFAFRRDREIESIDEK